jgi:DNA-binding transcriptional regulator YiaG
MTATELRATLARVGLTQTGAARLFGLDDRTLRRWAAGDGEITPCALRLLDLLEHVPGVRERLERSV